jgi:choline dehydrogenase-like flavoprotein
MTTAGTSQLPTTGTTNKLNAADVDNYDYLIVGGGTAGCVIASRLAEYLPHKKILLIEAGPSDFMDDRVLDLKQWLNLLGGELDYDYGTTEQPNGSDLCPNAATSSSRWFRTMDPTCAQKRHCIV